MRSIKVVTVAALVLSSSVSASSLSYNGYSLDAATNIVSNGNIEWLQWDATNGMSINQALSSYSSDGWRLASNTEMATLLNSFTFASSFTFDADENTSQTSGVAITPTENTATNNFIELFGFTRTVSGSVNDCCGNTYYYDPNDPVYSTRALFGDDNDGDGYFNVGWVNDDFTINNNMEPGYIGLGNDWASPDYSSLDAGVALVRGGSISAVPVPAAVWLFGSGLIGLVGLARRKA